MIVAAPVMAIGLLNVNKSIFACKTAEAAMVNGLAEPPKAKVLPTFRVPLFKTILVLTVFAWLKTKTPPEPASVKVSTLIDLVCVSVAVSVMVKPLPVNPSTPDRLPITRLEAVWKLKLPVPMLPATVLITEFAPVSE